MAIKVGDTVRFLNYVGGGIVVKIKDNLAYVADEDGFETPILCRECVVVTPAKAAEPVKVEAVVKPQPAIAPTKCSDPEPEEEPIVETLDGEKLNIVLGFEAQDLKRLSQSKFDAYLVNDSNYFLYFTFLTRAETDQSWHTHFAGLVEPNYQLLVGEFETADLPEIERVAIQILAFKRDKDFAIKAPIFYESRLDTTKFAKLHCFRDNVYFDTPVIAIDLVKDDMTQRGAITIEPEIEKVVVKKNDYVKIEDRRKKIVYKKATTNGPIVTDLHINELLDNTAGLSNADMLNFQIDKFREVMDENINFAGRKLIFIHGKGEGVLRNALLKELNYRYSACEVQDASFREYGYGATQVTIHSKQRKS